jgi:hypothetical protein
MDSDQPTASVLYNYDTDRDSDPGLLIAKGGSGPNEADPTKHQHWQWPVPAAVVIEGDASVKLWSAMKGLDETKAGAVTVYLRDCAGSDCVLLGSDTQSASKWQGWVLETFTVPVGAYALAAGHSLELVVIVEASSGDDMWFAYDTNNHKSRLTVFASSEALTLETVLLRGLASSLSEGWARLLFA